ncbi:1,2-phenylacetyl-CoA epoxidase subunit PaaD [Rossellomorea marisflavi]|uniref:Phenylacetate-CoA oxygenase subunit PaaJ n=1 Tax=Rossellomorea marisflavi TaxID=189381 RepID=A0A0J5SH97_9BACI|nr:1,2-phenylacetyl-CoA epoxidase subunit PaaD [Rossellomorea marisflavi]KMK94361.1 phenylacetate-CoA oxygenase [Rossellomorea marisflavi]KML08059.1 phenylacetate-CoA oxygenase [Rossellomorea marisflavi]KML34218.1 phenylacetate-CoA oxygenase [Rossellomorea marisflavi]KZE51393.1 phenylacetate-CoA oxygenase subunit PaaJ [Rossellomorea marisflavi]MCM2606276.1 phenylacetate-CoA oxygenase subunit PaaJ [Rossellomorea marisflavi]
MEQTVMKMLETVKDPEIDSISIVDLGMVHSIEMRREGCTIKLLPTFAGCPALDIIKGNVKKACMLQPGIKEVEVRFVYTPPWTSDRLTQNGREKLKEFGIAPPPETFTSLEEWEIHCPYCDSHYTSMENLFGPTACRSILYCKECRNPFEAMKPISTTM